VEPGGEVLEPELVGLEHVPVDVDDQMIRHPTRSVPTDHAASDELRGAEEQR
jgi:hypothetical protein